MLVLSNTIEVTGVYSGQSTHSFWSGLKVGDIIYISMEACDRVYGNSPYATTIYFTCKGVVFSAGLTQAAKYLDKIKYKEI